MTDGYVFGTRVRATKTRNEVSEGDIGTVIAAWVRATPLVRWDKDGKARPLRKRNMEVIDKPIAPDVLRIMLLRVIEDREAVLDGFKDLRLGQDPR